MSSIQYYSTNYTSEKVRFWDALIKGQAPDKGLYMPESIPTLTKAEIDSFKNKKYFEIAYDVIYKFLADEIPPYDLYNIVKDSYNFDVPIEHVYDRNYIMRLDQGPTCSFKDFAARLMGRLMQYYLDRQNKSLLILTATSGDTGSAIANAFYDLHNIKVVILFPEKEVTERQRKQMTTLHKNISIIALNGKFDDCQALVKQAFADPELDYLKLSSANSINIGRLLPQSVYYFWAYSKLVQKSDEKIIFSVPSGNFGDLMGGIIAREMGLPVKKFIVSTNENNEVPLYFQEGFYKAIVPSRNCISSAMNVGHPSNFARIISLYGGQMDESGKINKLPDIERLRKDMYAVSIPDSETRDTIKNVYDRHKILIEPHGAVGWAGLQRYINENRSDINSSQLTVTLETAHPAKFPEEIEKILGVNPNLPPSLTHLDEKEEKMLKMDNSYKDFKEYLRCLPNPSK
jgi:threonine synthase